MQLFKKTNFDFIGARYKAYAISAVLLLSGVVSMVQKRGLHLGIDFTGGSLVQIAFKSPVDLKAVREALSAGGYHGADLQDTAEGREVMIRIPKGSQSADTVGRDLYRILQAKFPDQLDSKPELAIKRAEYVGPAVGNALKDQALGAIFWASVLIILYVAFRFQSMVWGVCSIAAVVHDVLSIVGIFSILNKEITITVVAGILTLAGYSMNDTIVVYDRMRENLRLSRKEDLGQIINRSINETLSRTVMTSMTVAMVLVVLFVFGGEVIHDFAFAMLWGVFVGSYSSIFVAAPLIYEFQRKRA